MATKTGREMVIGLKKAAAWGTAVACGAGDGVLLDAVGLKKTTGLLPDKSAASAYSKGADRDLVKVSGAISGDLRYEGFDTALALVMGSAASPAQIDTTSAYGGLLSLASTVKGQFASLAALIMSDRVHEWPSVKLAGFTISGERGGVCQVSFDCLANDEVYDSTVNTAASMASVTYSDAGNRVIFTSGCYFRINDQTGAALSSTDNIYPSSFEVSMARTMEGDYTGSNDCIDEPDEIDDATFTITLQFPKLNDDNKGFFADWDATTAKKLEIGLIGKTCDGTNKYSMILRYPHVLISDVESLKSGPGKVPSKLVMQAYGVAEAVTGMSGLLHPMEIATINTRTTSPLA